MYVVDLELSDVLLQERGRVGVGAGPMCQVRTRNRVSTCAAILFVHGRTYKAGEVRAVFMRSFNIPYLWRRVGHRPVVRVAKSAEDRRSKYAKYGRSRSGRSAKQSH